MKTFGQLVCKESGFILPKVAAFDKISNRTPKTKINLALTKV